MENVKGTPKFLENVNKIKHQSGVQLGKLLCWGGVLECP